MLLRRISASILLLSSIACFGLGLYFPILVSQYRVLGMHFSKKCINIFDSVELFFETGDYLIAIVILLFTFVFPIVKYLELLFRVIAWQPIYSDKVRWGLQNIDKWNMLDVFVVALLLLNFKMQDGLMVMEMSLGSLFIALSVITRIITIIIMTYTTERDETLVIDTNK